jgi:NAD(P)-dependent dehydrogenase (short-subunit alcohol dehydrogenase family)
MDVGNATVAVVTGAASGIGLALADAFAAAGCSLVLADVEAEALGAAEQRIAATGVDALAVVTDVSQRQQVEALATQTIERFGHVNVLCNNAGVAGGGDAWFGGIDGWDWVLGVNLWGVVHGVQTFLPHLIDSGSAHIVNTASIAGLYPGFSPPYDASKHAVVALTEGLYDAMTTAGLPVGVSCLCPGWIRTKIAESTRNWPSDKAPLPPLDAASEVVMKHVRRAIDEGMQPAAVADQVISAVRENRYWVFPNPEFLEIVIQRWHSIADQLDPAPSNEPIPGMPPREQIITEVITALSGGAS